MPPTKKSPANNNNQRVKFHPDEADYPPRKREWVEHRERVMTAIPQVDTTNPLVLKNTFSSPSNFNRSVTNFVRIEKENARMLHRIATIMESEPKVDTRLSIKAQKGGSNKSRERQMRLLDITFENLKMFQRIEGVKSVYSRKEQLEDYAKNEEQMELSAFYPLFWKQPSSASWDGLAESALGNAAKEPRPKVFLNLETDKEALGQIVIELRADVVPFSAENFRALCTGERGISYKCTEIHRIIPGILWQGGDVSGRSGRGCGRSIYGNSFPDENFRLKHREAGTVSMVNAGKDTNASQFLITAKRLETLNGVNVVVGKVISGMEVLDQVSALVTPSGRPKYRVWISSCGQSGGDGGGNSDGGGNTQDESDEAEAT